MQILYYLICQFIWSAKYNNFIWDQDILEPLLFIKFLLFDS